MLQLNNLETLANKKISNTSESLKDFGIFLQSTGEPSNPFFTGECEAFQWAVKKLTRKDFDLRIIDVGGHVGEWTRIANANIFSSEIHVFEPIEESFKILKKRCITSNGNNIIFNQVGVAPSNDCANFHIPASDNPLSHSSMIQDNVSLLRGYTHHTRILPCTTLKDYLEKISGNLVDFLKIDSEGMEYKILASLDAAIRENLFLIQFEFNDTYLGQRIFVKDFWDLLSEEFHFLRITKKGLFRFSKYNPEFFEFSGMANYLCVNKKMLGENKILREMKKSYDFIPFGDL
jgi:FkbM family methyltransferase